MSREAGFDVMDVSTAIHHDPKFRRLAREEPALAAPGFTVYVSTMAESWKAGERLSAEASWPAILPFDPAVVTALKRVRLLTAGGAVTPSAWREFFERARIRRDAARDRWRRANEKRAGSSTNDSDDAARSPRGSRAVTASTVLSESVRDSTPPNPPRRRGGQRNGKARREDYDAALIGDVEEPTWLAEPTPAGKA